MEIPIILHQSFLKFKVQDMLIKNCKLDMISI